MEEMVDEEENGLTIVLTPAQAKLFVSLTTLLLNPKKMTVSELKLNVNASDNLLRSLRRRFEKALRKDEAA